MYSSDEFQVRVETRLMHASMGRTIDKLTGEKIQKTNFGVMGLVYSKN